MEEFWNGKSEDTQKELLIDGDPEAVKELEDKEDLSSSSSSSSSDDEDEAPGPGGELIPSTDPGPGPGPVLVVVEDLNSSSSSSSSSNEDEAHTGPGEELIPSTESDPGSVLVVVVDDNNVTDDDSGLVTAPEPDYPGTESEVAAQWDEPEELVVAETISALLPENGEAAASENEAESSGTNVKVFPIEEEESLVADEDSSPPPSENVPTVEAESGSSVIVVEEIPECIGNPVLITTVVAREVRNPTSWRSCCGLFEVLRRHDRSS